MRGGVSMCYDNNEKVECFEDNWKLLRVLERLEYRVEISCLVFDEVSIHLWRKMYILLYCEGCFRILTEVYESDGKEFKSSKKSKWNGQKLKDR